MALVNFKKGLLKNLPATKTAGTFYVTTDERAIYLDVDDSSRIRLGDFQEFASITELENNANPNTTSLYYVSNINCLAKWTGSEYIQINRDTGMTSVELVGDGNAVTAAVYSADGRKLTLTKGATYMTAADVDSKIAGKVGELGNDGEGNAYTVKGYVDNAIAGVDAAGVSAKITALENADKAINERIDGVVTTHGTDKEALEGAIALKADTTTVNALADRVTTLDKEDGRVAVVEGKVATLEEAAKTYALKTEVEKVAQDLSDYETANDAAVALKANAADVYTKTEIDGKVGTLEAADLAINNKIGTVAEGKTVVGLIGEAQTAANNAQTAVDTLAGKVGTVEEGKTVVGMIEEAKYDDEEVRGLIAGNTKAIDDIEADYLKAADKTELEGKINAKVDQTAYDTKVGALEQEDARIAGLVGTEAETARAAEKALGDRIDAIDTAMGGLTGAMHFKGTYDEMPVGGETFETGDVIVVGAKEYVYNDGTFVELGDVTAEGARIQALEEAVNGKEGVPGILADIATNKQAIADEKARAEAKEAELAGADATNLQAAKDYADAAVEALNIDQYAKQTTLDAEVERIDANETAIGIINTEITGIKEEAAKHAIKTEVEAAIAAAEKASADADVVVLAEAQGYADTKVAGVQGALDAHTGNTDIHVTTEDKAKWNAAEQNAKDYADQKVDGLGIGDYLKKTDAPGYADILTKTDAATLYAGKAYEQKVDDHIADEVVHITAAERTAWNAAEGNAKAYADQAEADAIAAAKTETEGQVKALAEGQVATNKGNIDKVMDTLTWGSF